MTTPTAASAGDQGEDREKIDQARAQIEEIRQCEVQALFAGLSRRDWHATETAASQMRDKLDRWLQERAREARIASTITPQPAPSTSTVAGPVGTKNGSDRPLATQQDQARGLAALIKPYIESSYRGVSIESCALRAGREILAAGWRPPASQPAGSEAMAVEQIIRKHLAPFYVSLNFSARKCAEEIAAALHAVPTNAAPGTAQGVVDGLAQRIATAINVTGFENDPDTEKVLNDQVPGIARMIRAEAARLRAASPAFERCRPGCNCEDECAAATASLADPQPEAEARRKALEEAETAVGEAAWLHLGDDSYSQGMDAGARHQVDECVKAIRRLIDTPAPTGAPEFPQQLDPWAVGGETAGPERGVPAPLTSGPAAEVGAGDVTEEMVEAAMNAWSPFDWRECETAPALRAHMRAALIAAMAARPDARRVLSPVEVKTLVATVAKPSWREWCRINDVSNSHLSEFMAGKRGPGADMLAALGLEPCFRPVAARAVLTGGTTHGE